MKLPPHVNQASRENPEEVVVAREDERVFIEPRWPIALVFGLFIVITIVLRLVEPHRESLGPPWLVPGIEIALLVVLLAADPAKVSGRRHWLRPVSIALVASLAVVALISTAVLITELIEGGKVTESATTLLASGALIWLGNCLIFGLLYWLLDSGGPLRAVPVGARVSRLRFHAAAEPRARPARVEAPVRRLPDPRPDHEHRVQPYRCHALGPLGKADDGTPVLDLVAGHRPGDRPCRQHLRVAQADTFTGKVPIQMTVPMKSAHPIPSTTIRPDRMCNRVLMPAKKSEAAKRTTASR